MTGILIFIGSIVVLASLIAGWISLYLHISFIPGHARTVREITALKSRVDKLEGKT
jgi:hypothetical protein